MKNIYVALVLAFGFSYNAFSQDTAKIKMGHEAASTIQRNLHIAFSRTPATSNSPGNASQTYKGDDFIYGRVYFSQPLKDVLFLEKNTEMILKDEPLQTAAAMPALQLARTMEDKERIHKKIEALNGISRPYAERVMDNAVANAMKGKAV